jgi:hypothetical protein
MMYSKKFLKKMKVKLETEDIGYIYIFKMGDLIKIGKTKNHPSLRMKQLSISESADLYYTNKYKNYSNIEREFHFLMKDKRVKGSEWFSEVTEEEIEKLKEWKKENIVYE